MKRYIKSAIVDVLTESLDVREEISTDSDASSAILLQLAYDPDFRIRRNISYSNNLPYQVMKILSRDKDVEVRMGIASHLNAPSALLKKMILNDVDSRVRNKAMVNPNLTDKGMDLIYELSNNPDFEIRAGIAKNSNTPEDILITLSKDPNWAVRRSVADNPNTPSEVLNELLNDKNKFVADAARNAL